MFKRNNLDTASPVTVLSADTLAQRGINNMSDAIQSLSANGSGTLNTAFSANGAFASGASGASLRGLTTDSTVVLFDGMRGAYYPLADDGERNFVDTNTIPDAVVEQVQVLKDGASSNYGADAIAGVINIIMKKEIQGFSGTVEGGITQHGDGPEQRMDLTYGHGDLASDGYNFYISSEYQRDGAILNANRNFPFNTKDLNSIVVNGVPGPDTNPGATTVGQTIVPEVRPATEGTAGNIASGIPLSGAQYQFLNSAGCGNLTSHQTSLGPSCEQNLIGDYGVIAPTQTRFGTTAHLTINVGDNAQFYATATYYQNKVESSGTPQGIRQIQSQTLFSTDNLVLPALLPNGQVNPNDPFAVAGCTEGPGAAAGKQCVDAQVQYRFGGIVPEDSTLSHTYRAATGIKGTFGDGWGYQVDATAMHTTLDRLEQGDLFIPGLLAAVTNGTFNFVNPSATPKSVLNSIAPPARITATSDLEQIQGTLTKGIMELPGGELQFALSGQARYEAVNDPSANPNGDYFGLNPVSQKGHRYNESVSYEIDAPILKQVDLSTSGRFDNYSEGFSNFSPKFGILVTPIRELKLRSTFSTGFRVPSFAETGGTVTGFITAPAFPQSFINQHLVGSMPDAYVAPYSIGLVTQGNPNLKPEKSTNFTAGFILEPTNRLRISLDYYDIRKTHVITTSDISQPLNAYYNALATGGPLPAGVIPDQPDQQNPNSPARAAFVDQTYINANSLVTSGLDIAASLTVPITDTLTWTSSGEATYVIKFDETIPGIGTESFAGTLGPDQITAGSGTPRWRANWQNTLSMGRYSLTATAYYTSGYKAAADDVTGPGTAAQGCLFALAVASDGTTPLQCHVRGFLDFDLSGNVKVNDDFTFFMVVDNLFNAHAPFDPASFAGDNYNSAWAQDGIVGRSFKVGAKFKF